MQSVGTFIEYPFIYKYVLVLLHKRNVNVIGQTDTTDESP